MHLFTLVITPGPRRSAVARARELLDQAAVGYCDYWRPGGLFSDRLGKVERPEIDAWYDAQAKRRESWEADNPPEESGEAAGLGADFRRWMWEWDEGPYVEELGRLRARTEIDLARLSSALPSPIPQEWVPAVLVTPDAGWHIRPVGWEQGDPRWSRFVNEQIDLHRGGHCVVMADCHC